MTCGQDSPSVLRLRDAADWERGFAFRLRISAAGLDLEPKKEHALSPLVQEMPDATFLGHVALARGRCQEVFVLESPTGSLLRFDGGRFEHLATPGAALQAPTLLAWFPGRLFVAGGPSPQRMVALDEATSRALWAVTDQRDGRGQPLPPGASPFLPAALAGDRTRQRLYALIPLQASQAAKAPDIQLAIAVFGPGGRLLRLLTPPGLRLDEAALAKTDLAVAPDGTLYILDSLGRRVFAFDPEKDRLRSFPVNERPKPDTMTGVGTGTGTGTETETFRIQPAGLAVGDDGVLYLGDLRRVPPAGQDDDRLIHRFDADGKYLGPVAGYRGPVSALAVGPGSRIVLFDPGTRHAGQEPALSERRLRVLLQRDSLDGARGVYYSPPLDSRETGMLWHKLTLPGARIPGHSQVQISWRAITDPEEDGGEDERKIYEDLLEAGDKVGLDRLRWSPPLVNVRDALVREAPARYLRVRVLLMGAGQDAPQVPGLEAWFPRTSLLRHLPAVYQEIRSGHNFLERFLALFETLFTSIDRQIDDLPDLFDPDTTPSGFLPWLSSWLALTPDEAWPEERRRALLRDAHELYRLRGTREGLARLIETLTGARPLIVEPFQLACAEAPEMKTLLARLHCPDPFCFSVLLRPFQVSSDDELRAIRRLVEDESPAHTSPCVRRLEPLAQLDRHTYLDVNTYLKLPAARLDTGTVLGRDSLLGGAEPPDELATDEGEP